MWSPQFYPVREQQTVTPPSIMGMTPSDTIRDPDHAPTFEEALEALIVSSFATHETVEGEWKITTPLADAPNWVVDIKKVYSDDDPEYDPELIE